MKKQKSIIIFSLYAGAIAIIFLGIFFGAYSVLNEISFQVLNTSVPGIVIGILVAYLGLRYFLQVSEFKVEFINSDVKFSWNNFKKNSKLMKQK